MREMGKRQQQQHKKKNSDIATAHDRCQDIERCWDASTVCTSQFQPESIVLWRDEKGTEKGELFQPT